MVDARVYLGFHFRFADTAAPAQGRSVAEWAFSHFLLPINQVTTGTTTRAPRIRRTEFGGD